MASIDVRKENAPAATSRFEPFRWMRELFRSHPISAAPPWSAEVAFVPAFEVKETDEALHILADVPGVRIEDLDVSLTGYRLNIRGKRESEKEEQGDTVYVFERSYGQFLRSFTLPELVDLDHIRADVKNGVLAIVLPKKPELLPRKVAIAPKSS